MTQTYCSEGCTTVDEHRNHIARNAPTEKGECEVVLRYDLVDVAEDGLAQRAPVICNSRDTKTYIDVWGNEHSYCALQGHETRLKSFFPEMIQRSLYEDVRRQESLMPGQKAFGGKLREGVPVYDDSSYRESENNRRARRG